MAHLSVFPSVELAFLNQANGPNYAATTLINSVLIVVQNYARHAIISSQHVLKNIQLFAVHTPLMIFVLFTR